MSRRRSPLAFRVALASIVVTLVAVGVAALVSQELMRSAAEAETRRSLRKQADMVAALLAAAPAADPLSVLNQADTPVALLERDGTVRGDRWARTALGAERRSALAAGRRLTYTAEVAGRTLLVEARPLPDRRGVVLVRSAANAGILTRAMLSRQAVALLSGTVFAAGVGVVLARRLSRPLIRAATAAKAMAGGEREARVPPAGPVEVAEVAVSLNTLATALADSERRQREFLMSVSHELKTPLTSVKGFAEALADGVGDSRAAGRIVLGESVRMERLIADLLELARLEADDFPLDVARVDLTAVLRDADLVWAARCAAAGVEWHAELPERSVYVHTDPGRVRQIVDGLAENALRVTPAGRPIVLSLRSIGAHVVLDVRDGGPGLTPEDRVVAFQRSALYERYRGVRKVGTGLGLALVHALATRLGGSAEVGEAAEGGALFRIRLPLAAGS